MSLSDEGVCGSMLLYVSLWFYVSLRTTLYVLVSPFLSAYILPVCAFASIVRLICFSSRMRALVVCYRVWLARRRRGCMLPSAYSHLPTTTCPYILYLLLFSYTAVGCIGFWLSFLCVMQYIPRYLRAYSVCAHSPLYHQPYRIFYLSLPQ
jgi:hypothetical protein